MLFREITLNFYIYEINHYIYDFLRLEGIIFSKHRPIAIYFISAISQGPSNLYPFYPKQIFFQT